MILRNHGTLSVGATIQDAFLRIHSLERACTTQVLAMNGSAQIQLPSDIALARAEEESRVEAHDEGHASMVWAALLRMLDRRDSSYRE